jgi:hypothetical protein
VNSNQRTEFESLMEKLYAGFNMPISEVRVEAYWMGLSKMSLGQFSQCVDYALGEHGPERIPSSSAIWKISNSVRSRAPAQKPQGPPESPQSQCLRLVNGLFLKYLAKRRLSENFKGNIDIPARRKACLSLVDWISEWSPEELKTEYPQIRALFDKAMDGVKDSADDWLVAQQLAAKRMQLTDQDTP